MTSQAPVILNQAAAMARPPMKVSDSSRRQTRVNAGAPLKERTRGQIDGSAETTKQGEATAVNDLTLGAGSVITVAEASGHVDFLSHEVSRVGIRADPKKIQAIAVLPFPTSKKGTQSFLGALNYYGRFIQDFAVYSAALYQLKDGDFDGGGLSAAKASFTMLQTKEHESTLHPVLLWGRVLKDAEMNHHSTEKEVLALLLILKACFTTLAGKRIKVYTRFSTLVWLTKSKPLSSSLSCCRRDREGARKGRQVCSTSTVDGDKLR
ncbi:hypothetical protein PC110_g22216 [Phytophthora cactorum]|uniref:Reverse transcriptase RNase H-like domain-containing protein n=1 Tax=Phytophthora cactorum TaxID=29920 RepID=A0A329RA22_9STRA|nr:hypothetical protein PC110_g22216 [Phytophthora cactorum]